MSLENVAARLYERARAEPGRVKTVSLTEGLIVNVALIGEEWRVQFIRIGKQPAPGSDALRKWQDEIQRCRGYWGISKYVTGTPISNPNMYAVEFVFPALQQTRLTTAHMLR